MVQLKQTFKAITILLVSMCSLTTFTACTSQAEREAENQYVTLDYHATFNTVFLSLYDVQATYTDLYGNEHTDTITIETWLYTDTIKAPNSPKSFRCQMKATLKKSLPELTAEKYDLLCSSAGCAKLLNLDGKLSEIYGVESSNTINSLGIKKEYLMDHLNKRSEIVLIDYQAQKNQ